MKNKKYDSDNNIMDNEYWKQLYVLSEHWLEELSFFKDEMVFLERIISKYYIWIKEDDHLKKVEMLKKEVHALKNETLQLIKSIKKHLEDITAIMDNPFSFDAHQLKEKHFEKENGFTALFKKYKDIKKAVFEVTENIIDSEGLNQYMEN